MTLPPLPPLPAEQTPTHCSDGFKYGHSDATLQAYAEQYGRLCAEAERAECAKECEAMRDKFDANNGAGAAAGAQSCASAIRARGQR